MKIKTKTGLLVATDRRLMTRQPSEAQLPCASCGGAVPAAVWAAFRSN
jgi:hypothetical protein